MNSLDYNKYMRQDHLPHIWCAGCGNGIVLKAILRTIDHLGLDKNKVAMVSGIGCSSRTSGYVDFNTLHTTHGRALAFATGIKLGNPELTVIVVSGDGDAAAIGGNHLIHAARRNIDITAIIFNNYIYGMTGGQASPTTPFGKKATTAQFGSIDAPFNISGLMDAAGASFVARGTVYHAAALDRLVRKAITKRGFAVVEAMANCPTAYGRRNKEGDPVRQLQLLREAAVPHKLAAKMTPEELEGKIVTGILVDRDKPEYVEEYGKLVARVRREIKVTALHASVPPST